MTDMKFDCIIMNPPYVRNLHLKILAEAIKHLKDEKSVCVNLSPILWLEDPHAHIKQKSNLYKFQNTVASHIDELEVVGKDDANFIFGAGLFSNLGIYSCKKNQLNKFDTLNFWKKNYSDVEVKIFKKVYNYSCHLSDKIEFNKVDGIRVLIALIAGNRGTLPIYKDLSYVVDGKKNGKDWTKCKNNGGYEKEEGMPLPVSVRFCTKQEAQNFYDTYKTVFYKWLCENFIFDQNIQPQFLPFLGNAINLRTGKKGYEGEWTDDDLMLYFGITPAEQKVIEETMEKYNQLI